MFQSVFKIEGIRVHWMVLLVSLFSTGIHAQCDRNDVGYYLKQGFGHEQIVSLCGSYGPPGQSAQSNVQAGGGVAQQNIDAVVQQAVQRALRQGGLSTQQGGQNQPVNESLSILRTAVKAYDIDVRGGRLHYNRKMCYEFGKFKDNGFTDEACPDVHFSIGLKGLNINETGPTYVFFGSSTLYLSGDIQRRITNMNKYNSRDHARIQRFLESGPKTKLPIRSDFPVGKIKHHMQQLIDAS